MGCAGNDFLSGNVRENWKIFLTRGPASSPGKELPVADVRSGARRWIMSDNSAASASMALLFRRDFDCDFDDAERQHILRALRQTMADCGG